MRVKMMMVMLVMEQKLLAMSGNVRHEEKTAVAAMVCVATCVAVRVAARMESVESVESDAAVSVLASVMAEPRYRLAAQATIRWACGPRVAAARYGACWRMVAYWPWR